MIRYMKNILKIIICFFAILILTSMVKAHENYDFNDIYKEQYKRSQAETLTKKIPKESAKILNDIGVGSPNWENFSNISFLKIFKKISDIAKKNFISPFATFTSIIFIIITYAVVCNLKNSFGSKEITKIMGLVSTICTSAVIINPIIKCVSDSSYAIQNAAQFTMYSVPIISAMIVASGNTLSATSYQAMVMAAGQTISYIAKYFLVPFVNMLFGMSIISSVSPNMNLENFCKKICSFLKTLLKFISYIFTSILALQNLVARSADNLGISTLKFAIDNCVPIVGSTLSDSFTTVHSCIKLLKSGVGAFGIMACGAIFLSPITECFAWIILLNISEGIVSILSINKIGSIFSSAKNIISINLAIILCALSVLTVSCFILAIIGK